MNTPRACERCGAGIETHSELAGLCAACLLKASLEPELVVTRAGSRRDAPAVSDLRAHFPDLEILEWIGQGGMGAVYRVQQKSLGRPAALKVLSLDADGGPSFAERFEREAKLLASLDHPNIVSIYGAGRAGPHWYLLMELVEGASLRQLITSRELDPRAALGLVGQVCDALQAAHDRGVVHRDIKPENVIVTRRGSAKILDFGLAKLVGQGPRTANTITETGQVMGTVRYMAPEQWERPLSVDHRADIYSLGVVLYELLTGELPMGRFPLPSQRANVGSSVDQIVLKTLEKEPEQRYQQASEVRIDVSKAAQAPGAAAPAAARPSPTSAPASTATVSTARSIAVGAAALCALAVCALIVFATTGLFRGALGILEAAILWAFAAVLSIPVAWVWMSRGSSDTSRTSAVRWGALGCVALVAIVGVGGVLLSLWGYSRMQFAQAERARDAAEEASALAELRSRELMLGKSLWSTELHPDPVSGDMVTGSVNLSALSEIAPFARLRAAGTPELAARARWATVVWPMHVAMLTPSKVKDKFVFDGGDRVTFTIPALSEELARNRAIAEFLYMRRDALGAAGAIGSEDFLLALDEIRVIGNDRSLYWRARLNAIEVALNAARSREQLAREVDDALESTGLSERLEFGRDAWQVEVRGMNSHSPTARITFPDGRVRELDAAALSERYGVLLHLAK